MATKNHPQALKNLFKASESEVKTDADLITDAFLALDTVLAEKLPKDVRSRIVYKSLLQSLKMSLDLLESEKLKKAFV